MARPGRLSRVSYGLLPGLEAGDVQALVLTGYPYASRAQERWASLPGRRLVLRGVVVSQRGCYVSREQRPDGFAAGGRHWRGKSVRLVLR